MAEKASIPSASGRAPRRQFLRLSAAAAATGLASCSPPKRRAAVPFGRADEAIVLGVPGERFFPASRVAPLEEEFIAALERQAAARGVKTVADLPPLQFLAVSGGGENGAFGAGLLCGWSAAGKRPAFDVVTGVSTGALTAPFAFLGPDYDRYLRAIYAEGGSGHVMTKRWPTAVWLDDALADNAPLFELISRHVDEAMLAAIAAAYDAGRLLLVATTDLDAQAPVIWNIGAIARSGHPKAVDTIRRVLLASAALPGVFPPTMIDVTVDGKPYQEMHVDGGTFTQTFLYPARLTRDQAGRPRANLPPFKARAFLILNGRLNAEGTTVERRAFGIATRAISTMVTAAAYNDAIRIYHITQRDSIDYSLAYIGRDFTEVRPEGFDTRYMRMLFDYAYGKSSRGYDWLKEPSIL